MQLRLHSVSIGDRSKALGKTLSELQLEELSVSITALRRGKTHRPEP